MAPSIAELFKRCGRFTGKTKLPDLPPAWQAPVQDATQKALISMDRLDVDLQGSQRHASLLDTRNHITAKLRKKPPPGQELGPRVDTVHVYEDGDFISTYELKKQQEKASSEGASDVQREKKS